MSYVILTSKPGQFHTEPGPGIEPVERYDYAFCGQVRATFVIASLAGAARIRIVDETPPSAVNDIPAKFLPRFPTLEAARRELGELADEGEGRYTMTRRDVASA